MAILRPFGEIVASPFEVNHTGNELGELANTLKSLPGETKVAVLFSGLIAEKLYRRTLTEEMVYTRLCSVQQVAKSIDMITAQIASIVTLISEDEQIKKCAVRLLVHRIRNTCN